MDTTTQTETQTVKHYYDMTEKEQATFQTQVKRLGNLIRLMAEKRGWKSLIAVVDTHREENVREQLWAWTDAISDLWWELGYYSDESINLTPWEERICKQVDKLMESVVWTDAELQRMNAIWRQQNEDADPFYYDSEGQWQIHQLEMMGPPIKRDEDIYGWPDGFRGN